IDYDLKQNQNEKKKQYEVDVYFYIPHNIGINSNTYSSEEFYANLTNYLRLRTPSVFNLNKTNRSEWSLSVADKYLAVNLITSRRQKLSGAVIHEVKLFACYINTRFKRLNVSFS